MALNVDLQAPEGDPAPLPGEFFLLKRENITCTVQVAGQSKLKAAGVFYLSTQRIVFVSIPARKARFQSFEAPLRGIINERFNQPIFGANYLSGVATGSRLPNPAKFSLKFNSGGVGTFLRLFFTMMEKFRDENEARRRAFFNEVENGKFQQAQKAYFDPSDPSVVYVSQPSFAAASSTNKAGAGYSGSHDGKPPGMTNAVAAPAPTAPAPAPAAGFSSPPSYAAVATNDASGSAEPPPSSSTGDDRAYGGAATASRTAFAPQQAAVYGQPTYTGDGGGAGAL